MNVKKNINGQTVVARPVFKGGCAPAYWMATINERTLTRTFASASEAFRYVVIAQGEVRVN